MKRMSASTPPFKTFVKMCFPSAVAFWRRAKYFTLDRRSPFRLFHDIYRKNSWGDAESVSGPGSNLAMTEAVRARLPQLVQDTGVRSMLDIPCGDYNWMKHLGLELDYIGGDIVPELIAQNQARYGGGRKTFVVLDLLRDELPRVDLVLCRDCLIHFSVRNIRRTIRNIKKSGSTYLLTTTHVERATNEDIPTGAWRPINLQRPPFNFPSPLKFLNEECPRDHSRDKGLGLWKIGELPDL